MEDWEYVLHEIRMGIAELTSFVNSMQQVTLPPPLPRTMWAAPPHAIDKAREKLSTLQELVQRLSSEIDDLVDD